MHVGAFEFALALGKEWVKEWAGKGWAGTSKSLFPGGRRLVSEKWAFMCVFITAGPITKLFAGGGGGEWTTCAMIDDEPRPVWMSPLVTH